MAPVLGSDALVPPRPKVTPASQPFWDALAEHRVMMQRCGACGTWVHYPRLRCTSCGRAELGFHEVDPAGTLYSFTVARQATAPHFRSQVPQVIAIVELSNGVHVTTVLLADQAGSVPGSTDSTTSDPSALADQAGSAPGSLAAGAALEPVFLDGDDGITMLYYRPVQPAP